MNRIALCCSLVALALCTLVACHEPDNVPVKNQPAKEETEGQSRKTPPTTGKQGAEVVTPAEQNRPEHQHREDTDAEDQDIDVRAFTVRLEANEDGTLRNAEIEGEKLGSDDGFQTALAKELKDHVSVGAEAPPTGAILKVDPLLDFRHVVKALELSRGYISAQTPADAAGFRGDANALPPQPDSLFQSVLLTLGPKAEDRYLIPLLAYLGPAEGRVSDTPLPLWKVQLRNIPDGAQISLNEKPLGVMPAAVEKLQQEFDDIIKSLQDVRSLEIHLVIDEEVSTANAAQVIRTCSVRRDEPGERWIGFGKLSIQSLAAEEIEVVEDPALGELVDPATLDENVGFTRPANRPPPEAVRKISQVRLRQIGVGMYQYMNHFNYFPPAVARDAEGKPLLSWRVHLLPFLGEFELYRQFHLDEPWDSEHNRKLISRIPVAYQFPGERKDGMTRVMVFTGDDALFGGAKADKWKRPLPVAKLDPTRKPESPQANVDSEQEGRRPQRPTPGGPRILDIRDGTSNTILCVQLGDDQKVPWTKPSDVAFDPAKPLAALGEIPPDGVLTLFCDGSVHLLPADISPVIFKSLVTPVGAEPVSLK